jgi:hypothetical protein
VSQVSTAVVTVVDSFAVGELAVPVVLAEPVGFVVRELLALGLVLAEAVGLAETLGLAVGTCGVPPCCDVAANAAPAPPATRTKDVAEMTTRLRMVRSLPRTRAADAPAVFAAPAASWMASESVVSKSLDTAISPFGWSAADRTT